MNKIASLGAGTLVGVAVGVVIVTIIGVEADGPYLSVIAICGIIGSVISSRGKRGKSE